MKKSECKLVIKTIKNKDIPQEVRDKAVAEVLALKGDVDHFADHECIGCAFSWREMPSGHRFWSDIDNAKEY